jgi:hypothetical protein
MTFLQASWSWTLHIKLCILVWYQSLMSTSHALWGLPLLSVPSIIHDISHITCSIFLLLFSIHEPKQSQFPACYKMPYWTFSCSCTSTLVIPCKGCIQFRCYVLLQKCITSHNFYCIYFLHCLGVSLTGHAEYTSFQDLQFGGISDCFASQNCTAAWHQSLCFVSSYVYSLCTIIVVDNF